MLFHFLQFEERKESKHIGHWMNKYWHNRLGGLSNTQQSWIQWKGIPSEVFYNFSTTVDLNSKRKDFGLF